MDYCLAKYSFTNPICFLIRTAKSIFKLGNHGLLPVQGDIFAWNHVECAHSNLHPRALTPPPGLFWIVPSPLWILGHKTPKHHHGDPQRAPHAWRAPQHKFLFQSSPPKNTFTIQMKYSKCILLTVPVNILQRKQKNKKKKVKNQNISTQAKPSQVCKSVRRICLKQLLKMGEGMSPSLLFNNHVCEASA